MTEISGVPAYIPDQRNDVFVCTLAAQARLNVTADCFLYALQRICLGHLLTLGVGPDAGDDATTEHAHQIVIAQSGLG